MKTFIKPVKDLLILSFLYLVADLAVKKLGIPVPGPVAGMILLLIFLRIGILKPRQIETGSSFLLANLPFLFLPLVVATRSNLPLLKEYGGRILLLIILTTLTVMAVTGLTAQLLLRRPPRPAEEGPEGRPHG